MANLPIPDEDSWAIFDSFTGTGPLTFNFSIFDKADLVVTVDDVALDQAEFTLTGVDAEGGFDGGFCTLVDAVTAARVVVYRQVVPERTTDFSPSNTVPVRNIDAELDRLTAYAQDARRDIGRTMQTPIGETATLTLPSVADRAGKILGFDLDGEFTTYELSDGGVVGAFLPLIGGTLTGALAGTTATFSGVVIGATPTQATHLATKAYVDSAVSVPTGIFEVVRTAATGGSTGKVNLSGYAGRLVRVIDGAAGDNNVWEWAGLDEGQSARVKFQSKVSLLFTPPVFYSGTATMVGNYQAVAAFHGTMPVGPEDTIEVVRTKNVGGNPVYEVWISHNQFISRVDWAGSAREPSASYFGIGQVGQFDTEDNVVFGDGLFPVNGTSRKPYFGGQFFVGVGDTCGSFRYLFSNDDFGIGSTSVAVPHTDIGVMSTHFETLACKVYGADGVTLVAPDLPPAGWITGPGSILGQGWVAQHHFHHSAVPTRQSTPGGTTVRVVPAGQTTVIVRQMVGHDGANWFPGKASMEAAGTLAELAPFLDLSNIPQWNIPSLAWSILDDGYGNTTILATPAEDADCDFFSAIAIREWDNQGAGFDVFWRSDENMFWLGSVSGGSRNRGIGFRPGDFGYYHHVEGGSDFAQKQGGRLSFGTSGTNKIVNLRAGQWGHLILTLTNGDYAIFGISASGGVTKLGYSTAAVFSVTNGTASKWNVDISGGDLRIQNNTGSAADCYVDLQH